MCRILKVSRSGYYAARGRSPSRWAREDERLAVLVRQRHEASRGTYGSPRIHRELADLGEQVSRKRVARLMRVHALRGVIRRRFVTTTDSSHSTPVFENTLNREFTVSRPNQVWAADITYLRTASGWLYLAVVLDLFSRRVVGWSMRRDMRATLVDDALKAALGQRMAGRGLLHHSDRGSQYASDQFQETLGRHGLRCSMSRRGNCWDNAVVESFFGTLKQELVYRRSWASPKQLRAAVYEYIEVFYNRKRRHSSLGYLSPAQFEDVAA
jgi:transposase InsO family protein